MFSPPTDREGLCARHLTTEWLNNWYSDRIPKTSSPNGSPTMAADFCDRLSHLLLLGNEAGEVSLVDCSLLEDAEPAGQQVGISSNDASGSSRLLHSYPDPVFDLTWRDHLYALAIADNHVYVHDGPTGRTKHCLGFHDSNVRTVRFRPNHQQGTLASGGRDGVIALWDLRTVDTNSARNTPSMVISDAHGPRQGTIPSSSFPSSSKPSSVARIRHSLAPSSSSVTSFEFMPLNDHLMASIGQPDYSVRFWDIRYSWGRGGRALPLAEIPAPISGRRQRAFLSLCTDRRGSLLYAVSSDNNIYCFLTSNYHSSPLDTFSAPGFRTSGSFYIRSCLSPDDAYLLCGSTEGHAFIWPTSPRRQAAIRLAEHRFEVSCVAWSPDNEHVFVGGEDYASRLWRRSPPLKDDTAECPQYVRADRIDLPPNLNARHRPVMRAAKSLRPGTLRDPSLSMAVLNWPLRSSTPTLPSLTTDRLPLTALVAPSNAITSSPLAPCTPSKRPRQLLLDSFFSTSLPGSPKQSCLASELCEDGDTVDGGKENVC